MGSSSAAGTPGTDHRPRHATHADSGRDLVTLALVTPGHPAGASAPRCPGLDPGMVWLDMAAARARALGRSPGVFSRSGGRWGRAFRVVRAARRGCTGPDHPSAVTPWPGAGDRSAGGGIGATG